MNDTKQCHYIDARDAQLECQWVAHCMLKCPQAIRIQREINNKKFEAQRKALYKPEEANHG